MAKSWAATKRVGHVERERIIREADFTCAYCGGRSEAMNRNMDRVGPDGLSWQIDHVRPANRDDASTLLPANLVLACATCNALKGARDPGALRDELARLSAHIEQMVAHWSRWPDA